jgi:LacI family transcriptional regulator
VLCGQDRQALQVYLAAAELGLKIGHDLAVISFDNEEPICSLLRPGLSTMALPYFEMGRAAVETAIADPAQRKGRHQLPCTLVDRQSFSHRTWT